MDTLHIIMVRERKGNSPECFAMFACRDKEPHCAEQRKLKKSKACASCVRGDDDETLEHLIARLERGDA